jgi:hypothetical protein
MAKKEEKTVKVLSQRLGDIITAHGVLKYNEVLELPEDVAVQLMAMYPELRVI